MGGGVSRRLMAAGFPIAAYDRDGATLNDVQGDATYTGSLQELAARLPAPRIVLLFVPAGDAVEKTLFGDGGLQPHLEPGDIVVDAGNSHYKDSMRRAARLAEQGVHYIDCGTSGGIGGATEGYCLMVGGDEEAVGRAEPVLRAMAAPGGFARVGPVGSGHYTKIVHNAIEYGVLQAMGEGFELIEAAPFDLNPAVVAKLWTKGSVLRGWLMELAAEALEEDPRLEAIKGEVGGGSTGRWAIEAAWDAGVPFSVIAMSYALRHRSKQTDTHAGKVVAALRRGFGGHDVVPATPHGDGEPASEGK